MSLIGDFARMVAARPKKVALITSKSQLTFEDMLNLILAFDIELTTRGVRPGATLVLDSKRAEFCLSMAFLLNLRSYTVIFAPAGNVLAAGIAVDRFLVTEPDARLPEDKQIVIEAGWFATLGTITPPDYAAHQGDGGASVFQSSGSTGVPKFIRRKVANRVKEGVLVSELPNLDGRRMASTLGITTSPGQKYFVATLLAGGSALSLGEDRMKILPYFDMYRVDTLCTSPDVVRAILQLDNPGQFLTSLSEVKLIGAPSGPELLKKLSEICPARLSILFGTSEIGSLFHHVYDPSEDYTLGQMGRFMRSDLDVGFYDEDHRLLPGATEGIIGFRPKDGVAESAYVTGGDDALTGFKDGVFFSGDIMRREGEEYFLTGRVKNIVNFSGNKTSLDLVRQVLEEAFPGSTLVPVVDVDANGLERLAVFCKSAAQLSAEQLTAPLAPRFQGLKVSRAVAVPEFPLTDSGKIDIQALKARL